jgi:hypothetical protein
VRELEQGRGGRRTGQQVAGYPGEAVGGVGTTGGQSVKAVIRRHSAGGAVEGKMVMMSWNYGRWLGVDGYLGYMRRWP